MWFPFGRLLASFWIPIHNSRRVPGSLKNRQKQYINMDSFIHFSISDKLRLRRQIFCDARSQDVSPNLRPRPSIQLGHEEREPRVEVSLSCSSHLFYTPKKVPTAEQVIQKSGEVVLCVSFLR